MRAGYILKIVWKSKTNLQNNIVIYMPDLGLALPSIT